MRCWQGTCWQVGWWLLLWVTVSPAADSVATAQQLQQLEIRIQELKAQMHNTRTEYGSLQWQLQGSEESIGEIAKRLEKLHGELADKRNTLKDLEVQQEAQYTKLAEQRQVLAQQIRAAYITGRQGYLKMWLNQQDPSVIGRVLTYYNCFNRARTEQINAIKNTLQRAQALKQEITKETAELNQLVQVQSSKKHRYELSYEERQKILAQLAHTLKSQDKELKRLQEDKRQLKILLGTLENILKSVPLPEEQQIDFAKLRGKLPIPVSGHMLKRFGEPLIGRLKWQGVLIGANLGSKVRAVAAGRIAFAEWFRSLGLLVIIDHDHDYMSLYAHNRSLYTKTGNWVEAGDIIASVGNSGGREIPALYFEIRRQGVPVNPLQWLYTRL